MYMNIIDVYEKNKASYIYTSYMRLLHKWQGKKVTNTKL